MIGFDRLGKNGRFGNQMFQYAALKGIAKNNNYDFCVPSAPKTEEDFYDEENQNKLFIELLFLLLLFILWLILLFVSSTSSLVSSDSFNLIFLFKLSTL